MYSDSASMTYQNVIALDRQRGEIPEGNLRTIESVVDTTKDRHAFLVGIRVLSKHGFSPEKLDEKVLSYNERIGKQTHHYLLEDYILEKPDGTIYTRKVPKLN